MIRKGTKHTCRLFELDEFRWLLEDIYGEDVFVSYEPDGATIEVGNELVDTDDLHRRLAEALDVEEITSFHTDNYMPVGVWIVVKEKPSDDGAMQWLKSYVYNDLMASEPGYIYDALTSAGANHDDIRALGFGFRIPPGAPDEYLIVNGKVIDFDTETSLGEPQAWIYLKDGTSIEVTHEEDGLDPEDQYYSARHHCSEEDFENDVYHSTMGVIDQCSGTMEEVTRFIENAVAKAQ